MKKLVSIYQRSMFTVLGISILAMPVTCLAGSSNSLADSLQQSLRAQGWHETIADDGNIIYRRTPLENKPVSQPEFFIQDRKDLGLALQNKGWNANWTDDGSLILRPKVNKQAAETETTSVASVSRETTLPDMSAFEYWRVVKSEDGSMVFHPVTKEEAIKETVVKVSRHDECLEAITESETINLPVDQWEEVYEIAQNWLAESGVTGLAVGHSRPVSRSEWFHLVNLVSEYPPYYVHYKIAIRASDGKVVVLQ